MGHRRNGYNILVSLTAALGSLTYGYSISTLGNALSKPVFNEYMGLSPTGPRAGYTTSIIAVWNCILYAGGLFGCGSYPLFATRFGRRKPIALASVLTIIGSALQAGTVNATMLAISRFILGLGVGMILSAVPIYQAEIAPPSGRGMIVGTHASMIGIGMATASWIGVGFFHVSGSTGWRAPFAIQCFFPLLLLCVVMLLPESPRWLYTKGKAEAAEKVLVDLHRDKNDPDHTFAHNEMRMMRRQLDYDMSRKMTFKQAWHKPSLRRRLMIGVLAMSGTQFSGLLVVLTYQSVIYGGLGFSPFMTGIMGAIWTSTNGITNFIGGILIDRAGRVKLIKFGYAACSSSLVILCVLTEVYSGTGNKAGNAAAAAFTFVLIVSYGLGTECPSFVYTAELFPTEWRALGVSLSTLAIPFWSILFTAVASPAFATIGAKYYIVFASLSAMMFFVVFFLFPETKGYTLEQIAALFGDEVVDMSNAEGVDGMESNEKAEANVHLEESTT